MKKLQSTSTLKKKRKLRPSKIVVTFKSKNTAIEKPERIEKFLEILGKHPPASNKKEAYKIIDRIFVAVENAAHKQNENIDSSRGKMTIGHISDWLQFVGRYKNVFYTNTKGHVLIISENGAIEIHDSKKIEDHFSIPVNPSYSRIFEKFSADGKNVWQKVA